MIFGLSILLHNCFKQALCSPFSLYCVQCCYAAMLLASAPAPTSWQYREATQTDCKKLWADGRVGSVLGLAEELSWSRVRAGCGEMPVPVCTLSFWLGMSIFSFLYKEIKREGRKGSSLVLHDAFPVPKHCPCLNAGCGDGKGTSLPFQVSLEPLFLCNLNIQASNLGSNK